MSPKLSVAGKLS